MIFCVEKDDDLRDLIVYTFNTEGFDAKGFADADELFAAIKVQKPMLVVLDGDSSREIIGNLRNNEETAHIPVVLAGDGSEDIDADGYIKKPFSTTKMVSCVRAVLGRHKRNENGVLTAGKILLNKAEKTAFADRNRLNLTQKEYELLLLLMENPGKAFSREELLLKVWGGISANETRTVDVHIGTLRTKLGDCVKCIETVRGVGYRFMGSY